MGKRADQAKKRRRLLLSHPPHPTSTAVSHLLTPPSQDETDSVRLVSSDDLETTILALQTLCENPAELAEKEMKELKRATFALHKVMVEGATLGTSLTSKISTALQDYRFTDALVYLFEMYTRRLPPKLGALQRWVRECDATSEVDGTPGDNEALKCLDLILRIANMDVAGSGEPANGYAVIKRQCVWSAREGLEGELGVWEMMKNGALHGSTTPTPNPNFRVVHHTPGPLRRPPNLYNSTVYASSPNTISFTPISSRRTPSKLDVTGVAGAFVILDVFTPEECLQIVQAASSIGFERDEASQGSARLKTSILARNFVWLADRPFLDHFYGQIRPFVPPVAPRSVDGNGGGQVRGINARFRVYQYTENQVYRPHIDGAWPAAGLDPSTGEYLHDSSPPDDPLWSRYTLLVYLNSDIPKDTGCTTFFLPSPSSIGTMEATSVRPVQGAVLCFPHGDTQGSLLHEGSAVGPGGGKLVIRTDLLYEARGFGTFKPPASVGIAQGGKAEEGAVSPIAPNRILGRYASTVSIPETQRVALIREQAGPIEFVGDYPVPTLRPDEVLAKVLYTGVCQSDLHTKNGTAAGADGQNITNIKLPHVGGHEGVGRIVAVGRDVKGDVKIGGLVGIRFISRGMTNHLHHEDGAFQQFVALDGDNLTVLPDDIDPVEIGPVLCAGITAYK
ncbi:MAG: hypothetical protein TREMPRED_001338, partial [Tremellales sp. Tagirdzhanova-0007]